MHAQAAVVADVNTEEPTTQEGVGRNIRSRILHVLTHYPVLSPSMLQVGIGPSVSPRTWHPILDALISEGLVVRTDKGVNDPSGRYRSITQIQLVAANT